MQPRGRQKKNKETGEEEYAVRKNHSHHFCFSTLHSIIPNLSVGGVVAGTTPVIIDEEAALSRKEIGGNCALLTDEIQTASVWRRLWGRHFQIHIWKGSFHQPSMFGWNPTQILPPWLSKSKPLQPPLKNSPNKTKKWSYDSSKSNGPNRMRIGRRETRREKGITTGEVPQRPTTPDEQNLNLLREMMKEMDELRSAIKERTDRSVDKMVRATDSPFTVAMLECHVPSKFRLPQLEPFDGLKVPQDHFNTFKTTLGLQQPPDEIMCRSFPTTLKGAAREWFTKLPTSSIDNFDQLSSAFLRHFIRGQHPKRPVDYLLIVRQGEKETLRS